MLRIDLVGHTPAHVLNTVTSTLNEFVLVGGDATSDNLPPRFSQIQYAWRSPSLGIQQQIYTVQEQNARHVAAMTGCRASVRWVTKTRVGLTNHAMTDLTFANMELVGPPRFPDEARDFAWQSSPISASKRWKARFSTTTSS